MCGLAGFLCAPAAFNEDSVEQIIAAMTAAIRWRGPDSFGAWSDPAAGIALGHARLSIVDLSTAGQQPMTSASGRYVVAYNGEIYNHTDLRARLEERGSAPPWRGHSDTETLVAGLDAWGVHSTIEQLVGMFAIAIWDRHKRKLLLVRDRLGEKPLCFGWQGRGATRSFIFGSELFALAAHPSFDSGVNRDSLVQMLRYGHVGEDNSIRVGVSKVKPGEIVEISLEHPDPVCRSYWDGGSLAATASEQDSSHLSASAAVDQLEALLLDTVSRQMMSDVALGAFLSGGIDSSMIVALMQRHSDRAIHTFSIGFQEERYNEAEFAKAVAHHIGTKHTELYVGEAELLNVVPKLADIYDEPFADSSQIPTYLVAKLARNDVTVALSGDGGDELFCGYPRYLHGDWLVGRMGNFPHAVRAAASAISHQLPRRLLNSVVEPFVPTPLGKESPGQRIQRISDYAESRSVEELHRKLVSKCRNPQALVTRGDEPPGLLDTYLPPEGRLGPAARMMQLDMLTYLPDDILTKVDRATMAVSLESRAPFLDHRVVEFALSLPHNLKFRDGQTKWVLRQVLYKYVPQDLIERPKMGFEVPIGLWLRGALKEWGEALLDRDRLQREGYLSPDAVRNLWKEHQEGISNWGGVLWNILMFQTWLERNGPQSGSRKLLS